MVEATERMRLLIADILASSAAAQRSEELGPVDCGRLMDLTLEALEATLHDRGAEVVVSNLPTVPGVEPQLAQLFQNLLANAVKFTPASESPRVDVSAECDGSFHEFSVSDRGIGVEAQYRERIFGMFQRLHRRDEFAGSGLGLAICRKITERHGGEIWVQDTPGGGADFRFTLPVWRPRP